MVRRIVRLSHLARILGPPSVGDSQQCRACNNDAESSRLLIRGGRQGDMVEIYDAEDYEESDNHAFIDIAHLSLFRSIFFVLCKLHHPRLQMCGS